MNNIFFLLLFFISSLTHAAPGVVVLAGGGPEGDIGITTDWSYPLYKKLIENGDTTGDKKIKVVVISLEKPETNFMVDYLKSMGADSSMNLVVDSRKAANDPKVVKALADADVVFFRGGNQGKAYQNWKGTKLHEQIKALAERGGAIGGTSSGSMGLSEYSITGGQDYATKDIFLDAHSEYLNDEKNPKTSGIHNDFLNLVPGVLVDTHCGERGRIGRLLGTHAKAVEDFKNKKLISICLEEKTGIAITNSKAEVYGTGSVHFMHETEETKTLRPKGKPLVYTDIRDDALTEGWSYDLSKGQPDLNSKPPGTIVIPQKYSCGMLDKKFSVIGKSDLLMSISPAENARDLYIANDAFSDERLKTGDIKRGAVQTYALKTIYDHPESSVVFLAAESKLQGINGNQMSSSVNGNKAPVSTMILDCSLCTHKSLSSFLSNQDNGDKNLHSPGLVNMRVHIVDGDTSYNVKTHETKMAANLSMNDFNACAAKLSITGPWLKLFDNQKKISDQTICN